VAGNQLRLLMGFVIPPRKFRDVALKLATTSPLLIVTYASSINYPRIQGGTKSELLTAS
jgi:hypothetical protein